MFVRIAIVCAALSLSAAAAAGPREDVAAATQAWADAFSRHDLEGLLALYDPEAVFWGTSSATLRDSPQAIADYFKGVPTSSMVVRLGASRVRVLGDIAVATGHYTFVDLRDGKEIARPAFPFEGAWYALADGRQLHLIVHERPRTLRGTTEIDLRDGHFAFSVSDYERTVEHLTSAGVPCEVRPDNVTPWKQVYVTDPDGNVIELNAPR